MLNNIILSVISDKQHYKPSAMKADAFENPATYSGWIYPIRYLLSLKYLKVKQNIVKTFHQRNEYPIASDDYSQALIKTLRNNKKDKTEEASHTPHKKAVFAPFFKSLFIYPVLVIGLVGLIFSAYQWQQQKRVENVLANYLPYFSDLLHRKLLLTHNNNSQELLEITNLSIKNTKEKILSDLPEKNGVRDIMQTQLAQLEDTGADSEKIMLGFKAVNTLFDKVEQPYYLSPKSFTLPCSSLIDAPVEQMMMLKELEALMSNNNPELCRTTMMTTYKVDERNQLFYTDTRIKNSEEVELPLFHVRRIDKVPAVDGALGLTFKDRGIGSIILVDRIKNFARESVLPALTFQGRNYIIPYWMQGHYEIEEAVTKGYQKDIDQIYTNDEEKREVKSLIKQLIKDKSRMQSSKMEQTMQRKNSNNDNDIFGNGFDAISVFLGKEQNKATKTKKFPTSFSGKKNTKALTRLDNVLYPSIEHHEAYHQINKKSWQTPNWLESVFKGKLNDNAIEHTLEELGAYLSQLANTDSGQNIWLSKLLIFSLNPMTKGQAEYYASSIILNAMNDLYSNHPVQANYIATVDKKTETFKRLLEKDSDEIKKLSRLAYQILFHRDVPNLVTSPSL